jgi:hypothetical protein
MENSSRAVTASAQQIHRLPRYSLEALQKTIQEGPKARVGLAAEGKHGEGRIQAAQEFDVIFGGRQYPVGPVRYQASRYLGQAVVGIGMMVRKVQCACDYIGESLEAGVYSLGPGDAGHDENPRAGGEVLATFDESFTDDRSGCKSSTAKSERR